MIEVYNEPKLGVQRWMWEEDGKLQHETPEEVRASIDFARQLWKRGILHYTSWASAIPVQGAELYDIARRHGQTH